MAEFATLQHATYTEAEWTAWDGVLLKGQMAFSSDVLYAGTDQMKHKVGNGTQTWSNLDYMPIEQVTVNSIGSAINGAASATPNDTDLVMSVESSVAKKNTWTQIKAFLKTYFDTVYTTTSAVASQITTAISGKEDTSNKSSSYTVSSTTTYANTKALVDGLATKVDTSDSRLTNNRGRKYFAYDNTTYTYTGTTGQTILKTIYIPAGTLTANSTLELYVNFVASGVLNAKTGAIYITTNPSSISGGTIIYSLQVGATNLSWSKNLRLTNKNSLSSQLMFLTTTQPYYSANSTSAKTSTAFDFSVDQYIHIYSSMLNAGDTVGISDYQCYIDTE